MEPKIHVHLHARDLARSREFYRTLLDSGPVKEKPGYLKFLPGFAPLNLAISERTVPSGEGPLSHLGIQFDSTAEVLVHLPRVKAAGIPVREEMGVDCCHANQDKFWVRDPDGNEWEVYHLNHDLEPDRVAVPKAPSSACCGPTSSGCGTVPSGAGLGRP